MAPPVKSILDRSFVYVNAANTDLRKSFAKYRREQRQAEERAQAVREEAQAKIRPIAKGKP